MRILRTVDKENWIEHDRTVQYDLWMIFEPSSIWLCVVAELLSWHPLDVSPTENLKSATEWLRLKTARLCQAWNKKIPCHPPSIILISKIYQRPPETMVDVGDLLDRDDSKDLNPRDRAWNSLVVCPPSIPTWSFPINGYIFIICYKLDVHNVISYRMI